MRLNIYGFWVQDISSFYTILANSLNFPRYFSHNLDSLSECLSDFSWIEDDIIEIHIYDLDFFLKKEPLNIQESIKDIFDEAINELHLLDEENDSKTLTIIWGEDN